ncbi:hypothetical protein [Sphingomonas qomolangmaensis]|uniref:DUF3077 domain-containing protein n=1 Tax=Sphingomonas qomolangmaensis TaxID=2918765 RepID=A0ABY5LC87_9SPHN|nr:hypothetical protein [Sphingomonas qomolangmaensis]UUL83445.1 hypothetical protein NMP03_04240 [Sphingomonas qomolangmaensis]
MNAPAKITLADVFPVAPDEDAYRASIRTHLPNIDDMAIGTRVEIMKLRDQAAAGCNRCRPDAYPVLAEAARIGTLAALSGHSTHALLHIRMAIWLMVEAARNLERGKVEL